MPFFINHAALRSGRTDRPGRMLSARLWGFMVVCLAMLFSVTSAMASSPREVVVGLYENEPKIFTDRNGRPSGIFVELLDAIAAGENWRIRYMPCEWSQCLSMLEAGSIDLMPDVAISDERLKRFSFHDVVALHSWSQVFTTETSSIESMLDLDGKRLAILQDSLQESALRAMIAGFDIAPRFVRVGSLEQAFGKVLEGEADAVVANHLFGARQAPRYKLSATPIVFQPAQLYFATPIGRNLDLLDVIDARLQLLKADKSSVYFQILNRWSAPSPEFYVPGPLMLGLKLLVVIGLLLGGYVLVLRARVLSRTREREKLVELVSESEVRFKELAESVHDVIWTLDVETMRFTYVSPSVLRLRGYTPAEVMALPIEATMLPDYVEKIRHLIQRSVEEFRAGSRSPDDAMMLEIEQPCRDGSTIWSEVVGNIALNRSSGKIEIRGVSRDISERKRAEAQIQQLAYYDQLTGLPNRQLLRDRFAQACAIAERHDQHFSLLFLDLDHFKNINDTLGHDVGDTLLVEVARRLVHVLRAGDTVCRLGGDEFILLLAESDAQGAAAVVGKLIDSVSRAITLNGQRLVVTPSVGIAVFPEDGVDLETLLKRADTAMYRAKSEGRAAFRFFTREMQERSERTLVLVGALREALEQNNQLCLHYQPQFELTSRRLIGVEALLRWTHPEFGVIPPGEFIPLAENNGLIAQLGQWVVQETARQLSQWMQEQIAPERVAVNLSAVQFRNADLPAAILATLSQHGVEASRLEVELTEAVAMDNPVAAELMLRQFAAEGVRVAIDDFGTGYSSLSHLKRFNVDKLKIDQSFVRDIAHDADDRAIVRAIIRLARSLNIRTIAEGVETSEQLAFLAAEGCDEVQGYLWGRPVPPDQLRVVLTAGRVCV